MHMHLFQAGGRSLRIYALFPPSLAQPRLMMSDVDFLSLADWDLSSAYCQAPKTEHVPSTNRLQDLLEKPVVLPVGQNQKDVSKQQDSKQGEHKQGTANTTAKVVRSKQRVRSAEKAAEQEAGETGSAHGKPKEHGGNDQQPHAAKKVKHQRQDSNNQLNAGGGAVHLRRGHSSQAAASGDERAGSLNLHSKSGLSKASANGAGQPQQQAVGKRNGSRSMHDLAKKDKQLHGKAQQLQETGKRTSVQELAGHGRDKWKAEKAKAGALEQQQQHEGQQQQEAASDKAAEQQQQQQQQQQQRHTQQKKGVTEGLSAEEQARREQELKQRLKQKWEQRKNAGITGAAPGQQQQQQTPPAATSNDAMASEGKQQKRKGATGAQASDGNAKRQRKGQGNEAHAAQTGQADTATAKAAAAKPLKQAAATSAAASSKAAAPAAAGESKTPGFDPTSQSQPAARSSSVIGKMMARLQGSRFRSLNETLYTRSGSDALSMMKDAPELFHSYHEGFAQQTKGWPKQPVDVAASWLAGLPASLVVADFGCGDARLMKTVKQKVHSFDLVASAPGVIACNMAQVPLRDATVDAAIFSLALMGTDYGEFLREACRVLKPKGWLWIAEVRSRFSSADGKENFKPFLSCLSKLGFKLTKQDATNKMFVLWIMKKEVEGQPSASVKWPPLKACVYKKR